MFCDFILLRGVLLLSFLLERGVCVFCLELYGVKGFIIVGRVRKGCNYLNYFIFDIKVKCYRMSLRLLMIILRLIFCLFLDVNLIDKKKIRNCICYIEKVFILFYMILNIV